MITLYYPEGDYLLSVMRCFVPFIVQQLAVTGGNGKHLQNICEKRLFSLICIVVILGLCGTPATVTIETITY